MACNSYQGWFPRNVHSQQVTIAIVASLVSIGVALVPPFIRTLNLHSQTTAFFIGTEVHQVDKSALVVRLTNVGGRPAQVLNARIDFGTDAIEKTSLDIVGREKMVVPAGGTSDLKLFTDTLNIPSIPATMDGEVAKPLKAALAKKLCRANVRIFVRLNERGILGELKQPARELEPITVLRESAMKWVMERATGADPDEDCS